MSDAHPPQVPSPAPVAPVTGFERLEILEGTLAEVALLAMHERARRQAGRPWAELDRRFVRTLRQRMATRSSPARRRRYIEYV